MDNKVNGAGTVTGRDDNKFEIKNLNLHYGDFHALKNIILNIQRNCFMIILREFL